jgi:hypothetical protein
VHARVWQLITEQETARRWNMLTGKETMATSLPLEPLWCEHTPEVERILMVDFADTQARAKGAAPSANHEEGQTGFHYDQDSERLTFTHR